MNFGHYVCIGLKCQMQDSCLSCRLKDWADHEGFAYHPKVFGFYVIYTEKSGQSFSKKGWDPIFILEINLLKWIAKQKSKTQSVF